MVYKYCSVSIFMICLLLGKTVNAQDTVNEFNLAKKVLNMEKRTYINKHIDLTEEEREIFWIIYDDFESKHSKLLRKRINLLQEYTNKYPDISNDDAKRIRKDALKNQRKENRIKRRCSRLMRRKLDAKIAMEFIQIEEYIQSEIKKYLLRDLPFVQ